MSKQHVSIILLTKNEQENVRKWGEWIHELNQVNELIVIDDFSTDDTLHEAKKLNTNKISVKVYSRNLNNSFADQRNFAVSKTSNDWILFLDADEQPSPKLINFLNKLEFENKYSYQIKRYLVYYDHVIYHGISATDVPTRLFNKKSGTFSGDVHEVWQSDRQSKLIRFPIFHYSAPSLKQFLEKINRYSDIRSQELFAQKVKVSLLDIIVYPKAKFIQYYFWHLGFVDGIPGIIICLSLSLYSFLVRAKLWKLYHP